VRFSEADSSSVIIETWHNRLQAGSRGGAAGTQGHEAKAGAHEAKAGAHAGDEAGSGAMADASKELPEGDEVPSFSPKLSKTSTAEAASAGFWGKSRNGEADAGAASALALLGQERLCWVAVSSWRQEEREALHVLCWNGSFC